MYYTLFDLIFKYSQVVIIVKMSKSPKSAHKIYWFDNDDMRLKYLYTKKFQKQQENYNAKSK